MVELGAVGRAEELRRLCGSAVRDDDRTAIMRRIAAAEIVLHIGPSEALDECAFTIGRLLTFVQRECDLDDGPRVLAAAGDDFRTVGLGDPLGDG